MEERIKEVRSHNDQRTYVHRKQIEAEFREALTAGERVIVFVGQAGMGKTSLARAMVERLGGSKVPPIVRFHLGKPNAIDVQRVLAQNDTGSHIIGDGTADLIALCHGKSAPPLIVLDNFESAEELFELFPEPAESVIIATCHMIGNAEQRGCRILRVDRMSQAEATSLVKGLVPNAGDQDALMLADLLCGYPLAIRYACTIIRRTSIKIKDFAHDFLDDAGRHLSQLRSDDNVALGNFLNRIVALVQQESRLARELLMLAAFMKEYAGGALDRIMWLCLADRSKLTKLHFYDALMLLERYSLIHFALIESTDDLRIQGQLRLPVGLVDMHPLIARILARQMFSASEAEVLSRVVSTYIAYADTTIRKGERNPEWVASLEDGRRNGLWIIALKMLNFEIDFVPPADTLN